MIRNKNNVLGFTLLELVVVMGIFSVISVVVFVNFRSPNSGKSAQNQTSSVFISDLRRAQSMALAGSNFNGLSTCGFGIHYTGVSGYFIYAGYPASGVGTCATANRNYEISRDEIVESRIIKNNNIEVFPFYDVFFEAPDPTTYIDNALSPSVAIVFYSKGKSNCGVDTCTTVTVYKSGKIDVQ